MVRSRSRSFSPDSRRGDRAKRSRSREKEKDQTKEKEVKERVDDFGRMERAERPRSRSPKRHRSRSPRRPRSRSRSPRRKHFSRSKRHERSRSKEKASMGEADMELEDDNEEVDEEAAMAKMMGFAGFDTTKGKHVPGACNLSHVKVAKPRKYRQYMNRRGGFNRPLDYVN